MTKELEGMTRIPLWEGEATTGSEQTTEPLNLTQFKTYTVYLYATENGTLDSDVSLDGGITWYERATSATANATLYASKVTDNCPKIRFRWTGAGGSKLVSLWVVATR